MLYIYNLYDQIIKYIIHAYITYHTNNIIYRIPHIYTLHISYIKPKVSEQTLHASETFKSSLGITTTTTTSSSSNYSGEGGDTSNTKNTKNTKNSTKRKSTTKNTTITSTSISSSDTNTTTTTTTTMINPSSKKRGRK